MENVIVMWVITVHNNFSDALASDEVVTDMLVKALRNDSIIDTFADVCIGALKFKFMSVS